MDSPSTSPQSEKATRTAIRACFILCLAALTAAVAARVVASDALYDRYLVLAAVAAFGVAATLGRRQRPAVPRAAAIGAVGLLTTYAFVVYAYPPPQAGLKAILARAFPSEDELIYVEGGNGVASLWSEASGWRLDVPQDPAAFAASRGDVCLRIERIDGVSDRAELSDYADRALSDLVDRGELVLCDAEGPGDYGARKTAWRSFTAYDGEADETPSYGVLVVYVDGDSVYGGRIDGPNPETVFEAAPAAREVLAVATSDPAGKSRLRAQSEPVRSEPTWNANARPGPPADPGAAGPIRFPDSPTARPKPYEESDFVRALRRMRFRGR